MNITIMHDEIDSNQENSIIKELNKKGLEYYNEGDFGIDFEVPLNKNGLDVLLDILNIMKN